MNFFFSSLAEYIRKLEVTTNLEITQREPDQIFHFISKDYNYSAIKEKTGNMFTPVYKILLNLLLDFDRKMLFKVKPQERASRSDEPP